MVASPEIIDEGTIDQFRVTLDVFEGPFDLLLQLISRKRLDITEVALAEVTDEFIAHMSAFPDLSRTTEFLVVAATLLNMKAAHLLPRDVDETDVDLEDLEARDLLFSRLLQYRAFKMAAGSIASRLGNFDGSYARNVALEPHFAALLPELVWTISAEDLARLAADALSNRPPAVQIAHLHDPVIPVATQVPILMNKLRAQPVMTFHALIADAESTAVVVSRFLAVLELFRRTIIEFDQAEALGELTVKWNGTTLDEVPIDDYEGETPSSMEEQ